jgi:hypothetical protein
MATRATTAFEIVRRPIDETASKRVSASVLSGTTSSLSGLSRPTASPERTSGTSHLAATEASTTSFTVHLGPRAEARRYRSPGEAPTAGGRAPGASGRPRGPETLT